MPPRAANRAHSKSSAREHLWQLLERALPSLSLGVLIVGYTTTSVTGTAEHAKCWADRGIAFQHAPVFMGPQNALESTGIMLASGERARFDALEPALAKMTGQLIYLGPQPERAAGMKLLGNLFLMAVTTGLADTLALAKALGIPHSDVEALFTWFNPGTSVGARLKRMTAGNHSRPSWELAMARKDAGLMIGEAERAEVPLAVIPAIAAEMDRWIAKGHGNEDWTVLGSDPGR